MDGMTLLQEARTSGLTVEAVGDKLVIRGPRRLGDLAHRLLEEKAAVMAALVPRELSMRERIDGGIVPTGWQPERWAARLRQMADACRQIHTARAAELEAWADNVGDLG